MNNELMLDVGQANELKLAFRREGDWTNEKIKALTERRGLLTQILDVLEGRSKITVIDPELISVDYAMSFEEMIKAGHYDWKNDSLTAKHLPIKKEKKVNLKVKLFHFNRSISSEDAKRTIEESGYQVAQTEHLLAYGAKNSEEQRKYPIVALGSVGEVHGSRRVPCLAGDGSRRDLSLDWWDSDWNADCRFLAVRKVTRTSVS